MHRILPATALARLAQDTGQPYLSVFKHGSLEVEIYRPERVDRQHPHSRDEVYVVIAGSGQFVRDGVSQPFAPGEVLFVPAGMEHRFEAFTEDFATWVFFYGPHGGEAAQA
jgi:mannose-6-phosphate isomerase-like protein (cupin superfamily)